MSGSSTKLADVSSKSDPPTHTSSPTSSSISTPASTKGNAATPTPTQSNVPAPPPPPKSSSQTVRPTSSDPVLSNTSSTPKTVVTSVTVIQGAKNSSTMTVTAQPNSTFSSPVVSTSTASDGSLVITTPPLVTVLSTSTEPDGALATVTQIVANPSDFNNNEHIASNSGLAHRPGLLAGICVVAGLVAALIAIGLIFLIRRNRRIQRRRRWLAGMQQQRPPSLSGDPFSDPVMVPKEDSYHDQTTGPVMRTVNFPPPRDDDDPWNRRASGNANALFPQASGQQRQLFNLYPDPHPGIQQPVNFSDQPENHELHDIGVAYSTSLAVPAPQRKRHSLTPSSPSIYPASLPADDVLDQELTENHDLERESSGNVDKIPVLKPEIPVRSPLRSSTISTMPPRPPRSHLRESTKGPMEYKPLTPPSSEPSSKPPSPISETRPQDILSRRTLLDVRTRSIS